MSNLQQFTRTSCGFATLTDITTKKLEDRLDSYFFSETLKYLYLLFDPQNIYNNGDFIFTTEGHPIPLYIQKNHSYPSFLSGSKPKCPIFQVSFEETTVSETQLLTPSLITKRELEEVIKKVMFGNFF